MKFIKLFENFKSSKLSKIWKYFESDKGFADRFKTLCDREEVRLSELDDNDLELLTTEETFHMLESVENSDEFSAHLFWFNDKLGYMMSCDEILKKISIYKSCERNEIESSATYRNRVASIQDNYDFCIILYVQRENHHIKNDDKSLSYIRSKRRLIDKERLTNDKLKKINIENYMKKLVGRIHIDKDDESLIKNFSYIVKKFFMYNEPLSYFYYVRNVSLSNIAKEYILLFRNDYDYIDDRIDDIKSSMRRVYNSPDRKFITDDDLLKDCVLDLNDDAKNILTKIIDINQLLKTKLTNFKFETVADVFIFTQLLKSLHFGDSEIDGSLCDGGTITSYCTYLKDRNQIYLKKQLRNLDIYQQLVEYTFKN